MVQNGPKTHLFGLLTLLPNFGRFPAVFLGSQGHFGVQKGSKKGQKGAKMAQNGQKVEKNRFLDSARNALKWHPKWSKTVQKHIFSKQKGSRSSSPGHHFDRISALFLPFVAHLTLLCPILSHFEPF